MPSVQENLERWQHHSWRAQGDEWSPGGCAAGTTVFWYRTVLPRIHRFVPTGTILEIGPGFGRWTQFLRHLCHRLVLVDLSARCIESCAARFAGAGNIEYHVNDGTSLEMIEDASVDFIFSFDSLVHAEADVLGAYLRQAARKFKPGAAGFIHHSNLAAFVNPRTGRLRPFVTQPNWRAPSMSAAIFREQCEAAGFACRSQELVNWIGKGREADRHRLRGGMVPLTDCFSVFCTKTERSAPTRVLFNDRFVDDWRQSVLITGAYMTEDGGPAPPGASPSPRPALPRKLATARTVLQREGVAGVLAAAWVKLRSAGERLASTGRAYAMGFANAWFSRRSPG